MNISSFTALGIAKTVLPVVRAACQVTGQRLGPDEVLPSVDIMVHAMRSFDSHLTGEVASEPVLPVLAHYMAPDDAKCFFLAGHILQ